MEGLLIQQSLARFQPLSPPLARAAWRFPDAHTLVLPIVGVDDALWIDLNPANPRVAWTAVEAGDAPPTPFAALLAARAVGAIGRVEQPQLDRRFRIHFEAAHAFVPQPACVLEVELTGRNANAILTSDDGRILGAWREIGADVNRYRQVRVGGTYTPPPPYDKPHPRSLDHATLRALLADTAPRHWPRLLDGVGPQIVRAWVAATDLDANTVVPDAAWPHVLAAFERLLQDPAAFVHATDVATQRHAERRERVLARVRQTRAEAVRKVERRLEDLEQLLGQGGRVAALQREADLLLAYAQALPAGASQVSLEDFDGVTRTLTLDPARSAKGNAQGRYERAKRWRLRAERAAAMKPTLEQEHADALRLLAEVDALSAAELDRMGAAADREAKAAARTQRVEPKVGIRVNAPHGFEVVVGRNARENDAVTFTVGRSLDLWLHAQGVRGAHVIVRSGGREVPADTLRFAAALAAGHAEVGDEALVLVDYTQRKHVWKVKGMPPGAVHYTQQRTLSVPPMRASAVDSSS